MVFETGLTVLEDAPLAVAERAALSVAARDDIRDRQVASGVDLRDRYVYDRELQLREALIAWRSNPLARRIVSLTTQYVVGGGFSVESKQPEYDKLLKKFWKHRRNKMLVRNFELCDEMTRAGDLFIVLSTDGGGQSYIRAIPSLNIQAINFKGLDMEQETEYLEKPPNAGMDPIVHKAYDEEKDPQLEGGGYEPVMLHYSINKPAGAQWGEGDLSPLLRWLLRHQSWLEDRVRLNHFRNVFMWVVKGKFKDEAERKAREVQINANPPQPGQVNVVNIDEDWVAPSPQLHSQDANEDGLAIKKTIATGAGIPMHFLAEPEGSTRTTAEQAGGPTYRHYEQRQLVFVDMLTDILTIVLRRATRKPKLGAEDFQLVVTPADISARDNAALAVAAEAIIVGFESLRDRQVIDDAEMLRMVYKFCDEAVDVEKMLARGKKAGVPPYLAQQQADAKELLVLKQSGMKVGAEGDPGAVSV